jgi:hypothetical protein
MEGRDVQLSMKPQPSFPPMNYGVDENSSVQKYERRRVPPNNDLGWPRRGWFLSKDSGGGKRARKCVATGRVEAARNRETENWRVGEEGRAMVVPEGKSDGSKNHRREMDSARAMGRSGERKIDC